MQALVDGRYSARLVTSDAQVQAALALRGEVFRAGGDDRDGFDDLCDHMVVTDAQGDVVACARIMFLPNGAAIETSYAAQSYDLSKLENYPAPMAELGRFCVHPDLPDTEILRVIWGALTRYVDAKAVRMLFGCTSFAGAYVAGREAALAHLAEQYIAPENIMPGIGSTHSVALPTSPPHASGRDILKALPPLLRTYLSMGAWVSAHGVLDHDLDTFHVFTGLEIANIPDARKSRLRALGSG